MFICMDIHFIHFIYTLLLLLLLYIHFIILYTLFIMNTLFQTTYDNTVFCLDFDAKFRVVSRNTEN